jgi:large subunit ribosomal protein L25
MKQYTLKIASRDGIGRQASRRIRQAGRIPAVVYGKLRPPQAVSIDGVEFTQLMKKVGGSAAIIEINDGQSNARLSFLQEVQRNAMTDKVVHVDLQEVSANEEMELNVAVHAVGDCVGVRVENGLLEMVSHEVRIRCLPKDLPEYIEVDVSNLHVGESIHIRDLPAVAGVKYLGDPAQSIISCLEPSAEPEATPAAGAAPAAPAAAKAAAAAPAKAAAAPAKAAPAGKK